MIARCTTCSTGLNSLGCAASSKRKGIGKDSARCRTGTWGSEPGHKQSSGLFVPGERPGGNAWAVIDQVRRRLRHAPGPARRAKAAPLATKGDQLVVAVVAAAQAQETVGEGGAFEERVELVLDELQQVGAGSVFGLGEESRRVLLHRIGLMDALAHRAFVIGLEALDTGAQVWPRAARPASISASVIVPYCWGSRLPNTLRLMPCSMRIFIAGLRQGRNRLSPARIASAAPGRPGGCPAPP